MGISCITHILEDMEQGRSAYFMGVSGPPYVTDRSEELIRRAQARRPNCFAAAAEIADRRIGDPCDVLTHFIQSLGLGSTRHGPIP
jgi:hypothetical protein